MTVFPRLEGNKSDLTLSMCDIFEFIMVVLWIFVDGRVFTFYIIIKAYYMLRCV